MTDYFIKRGESVSGPYSPLEVKNGVASGKILAGDGIGQSENGPWHEAKSVGGLEFKDAQTMEGLSEDQVMELLGEYEYVPEEFPQADEVKQIEESPAPPETPPEDAPVMPVPPVPLDTSTAQPPPLRNVRTTSDDRERKVQSPHNTSPLPSLANEIQRLSDLNQQGILSNEEFQAAKEKLIQSAPTPVLAVQPAPETTKRRGNSGSTSEEALYKQFKIILFSVFIVLGIVLAGTYISCRSKQMQNDALDKARDFGDSMRSLRRQ